jgi:hypothetical protein
MSLSVIDGTITNRDFPALFPFRYASQRMAQHISAGRLLRSVGETNVQDDREVSLTVWYSAPDRETDFARMQNYGEVWNDCNSSIVMSVRKCSWGHAKEKPYWTCLPRYYWVRILHRLIMQGVSRERGIKSCRSETKDSQKQYRNFPIKYKLVRVMKSLA